MFDHDTFQFMNDAMAFLESFGLFGAVSPVPGHGDAFMVT
jgi:hypothetical protein